MALPTAYTLEIAFATHPLATPTWVDVSDYLISASIRRGRNRELDRIAGSIVTFVLNNEDRRFDPTHTSSPYAPNVIPMRRIRLSVTHGGSTRRVFTGFVDRWPQDWELPNYTEVPLTASCGFKVCNLADLSSNLAQALSGTQIGAALDQISWPAGDRSIDAGQSTIQAKTIAVDDGVSALEAIQEIAESELGIFFMDGQGRAVFHDRHKRLKTPYTTSQATFGDDPSAGELVYEALEPEYDDDEIRNDVRVTREGGTTQTSTDATSINQYGKRTYTRSPRIATDSEALDQAHFLVSRYKDPALRFRKIRIRPLKDDSLWAQVLDRELGDRVTVKRRPPGGGAVISQACHIESIRHELTPGDGTAWETTFGLSPADENSYWVLGDAANSLLGQTTKLGY